MSNPEPIILAIESSCDDTSVAVMRGFEVLSNCVHNQAIHSQFGGVVPELASRAHIQAIVPTISASLEIAELQISQIDAVAVTQGPGLLGSLLVGHSFAKSLSIALGIPLINVHHMEGHMLSSFLIEKNIQKVDSRLEFPYLCLTVSGGHTQIVIVHNWNEFEILGQTLDDAVGEAFDKAAKLLSLSYPGGPVVDKKSQNGNPKRFPFNTAKVAGFDFSYSGVKTSILQTMQREQKKRPDTLINDLPDWCASIQLSLISPLIKNIKKAILETGIKRISIAGGVSANSLLREQIRVLGESMGLKTYIPPMSYTTDNAAMIGAVGQFSFQNQKFDSISSSAKARMVTTNWKLPNVKQHK